MTTAKHTKKVNKAKITAKKVTLKPKMNNMQQQQTLNISVLHKLGPYHTIQECEMIKNKIKKQVGHALFSKITKASKGYTFLVKHDYIERFPAQLSGSTVKKYLESQGHNVKVTVRKA